MSYASIGPNTYDIGDEPRATTEGQRWGRQWHDDVTVGLGSLAFNVKHFGAAGDGATDDTAAIQAALDAAETAAATGEAPSEVFAPAGVYLLTSALEIGSNTTLRASPEATFRRGASYDSMLINKSDGTTGEYGAASNISVIGGTWDANGTNYATQVTVLAFGHASDILISDVTVQGVYSWHEVELNAVKRVRVQRCTFKDFVVGSRQSECIQIDIATAAGFPFFGPYDNTPCEDITIEACHFLGPQSRAIGTHTSASGVRHRNITIRGNLIEDCADEAIRFVNWERVFIADNIIRDCYFGILGTHDNATICSGFIVRGNTFSDWSTKGNASSRAIFFQGASGTRAFSDGIISGNRIDGVTAHGITVDYGDFWQIDGNTVLDAGSATYPTSYAIGLWFGENCAIRNNLIQEAYHYAIVLNGGSSNAVVGNAIRRAGSRGIQLQSSPSYCLVASNLVEECFRANAGRGIYLDGASYCNVTGNHVTNCQCEGVLLTGASNNSVTGNLIANNSQQVDNNFAGLFVTTGSDTNSIQGNTVRTPTSAPRQNYGIWIFSADCDANFVTNNDLVGAGATAGLGDSGTGTVTTAGNRS